MLTERELTVLELLPSLLSLDEIATDLTLSVNTVNSDVRSIYAILGVSSRRTAVRSDHEHGMLEHRRDRAERQPRPPFSSGPARCDPALAQGWPLAGEGLDDLRGQRNGMVQRNVTTGEVVGLR